MIRRTVRSRSLATTLFAALVLVGLVLGPSTVAAQDASPSVDLAGTSIEIDGGETSTVTAEYEFEIASAGSGESELTSISGTMWQLPDREIGDISATVDGESVDASVTEEDRHWAISVPVADASDGDTVTVTLEYEVAGPAGEVRVPLWVPEYSTPGQANVVDATLTLPEGTTVSGGAFPSPTAVDGDTATYELLHVPGFVAAEYDESGPGLLTEDTLYSLLGVVVIVGFVVGGLAIDRKTA
ncbi:hypothetical protein [Halolamina rubra]|uniref:hypothetical protein n=1 Tax=Halolamina rubra TaxID=1380430 RepID=UPI000678F31C|nr:hypothetical protein [Halolamina rubra]